MAPGLAGIDRLVNAISSHDVAADARFTHADVDDFRVRFTDGHGADGGAADLAIGDWGPGVATVHRLPEPSASSPEVRLFRATPDARHRDRAAATVRSDGPP